MNYTDGLRQLTVNSVLTFRSDTGSSVYISREIVSFCTVCQLLYLNRLNRSLILIIQFNLTLKSPN